MYTQTLFSNKNWNKARIRVHLTRIWQVLIILVFLCTGVGSPTTALAGPQQTGSLGLVHVDADAILVVLYNDEADDGIDESDFLDVPHTVEISGMGQFTTGDSLDIEDGQTVNYRLRRGGVVGPWQQATFPGVVTDGEWRLEFATVSVVLYNTDDLLDDPHRVEVSNVAQFVTGETFHVPPGANISYRLRRGGVVGPWQATQFEAGDFVWELEFATISVVLYNAGDLLADPHRVEVSNVGQFLTGDTFHVPPITNISYRLRRGGVVGPWQATQFEAGDFVWELEFATLHISACEVDDPPQVEVSNVGTFNIGDIMHVPPSTNLSFRLQNNGTVGSWQSVQFPAGDSIWDLELECPPAAGTITAHKFDDRNGNGVQDTGEEDLSSWMMTLYDGFDCVGFEMASGMTNSSGDVIFSNLEAGEYSVAEEFRNGWQNTTPICRDITLPPGGSESVSYGNQHDIYVSIDIKPMSCPNPLSVKEKGVLPVAITGLEDFDVTQIDPATVRLFRKGLADPIKVAPLRWSLEDAGVPYEPFIGKESAYACLEYHSDEYGVFDGYLDLSIKFKAQEVVAALGEINDRDVVVLQISGRMKEEFGGANIVGEDVVWILKR